MSVLQEAKNVFTLARREIRQRWPLLAVAVVLGLVPLVAAAFRPVGEEARVVSVAEIMAAQALIAFLGLGLVGDELGSGRLAWYFARPLSGFAIWAGKVAGAGALALGMTFVMALPALCLVPKETSGQSFFGGMSLDAPGMVVLPLLFLGAGVAGGIIARGRSRWLLAVVATWVAMGLVLPWAGGRLKALERAGHDVLDLGSAIVVVLTCAFLLASAAGVIVGRADARRANAAASITMSGILAPAQIALICYVLWFVG